MAKTLENMQQQPSKTSASKIENLLMFLVKLA